MIANHIIFGAYGFWLPNDPRGSWSTFVGSWELFRYGPATKTSETRSVAHRPHDYRQRLAAKAALKRPAVKFTMPQIHAVAAGFAEYAERSRLAIHACAVLRDHVHLVTACYRLDPHRLTIQLKGAATTELSNRHIHPFAGEAKSLRPWRMGRVSRYGQRRASREPLRRTKSRKRRPPAPTLALHHPVHRLAATWSRVVSRDAERMVSRDAERMVSRDAERMVSRDAERMVSRDAERQRSGAVKLAPATIGQANKKTGETLAVSPA